MTHTPAHQHTPSTLLSSSSHTESDAVGDSVLEYVLEYSMFIMREGDFFKPRGTMVSGK